MKNKSFSKYVELSALVFFLVLSFFFLSSAQLHNSQEISPAFRQAKITMDKQGASPLDIKFQEGNRPSFSTFFTEYKSAFGLSRHDEFKSFRVFKDQIGQTHHRFKQFYEGVELAEVQYLLHEKDGLVSHAHGRLIHDLDLDATPSLSELEALQFALKHINAQTYMWENPKNEAFLKREQSDPQATYFPTGNLMLSAGHKEMVAENFRLVYRFDIFAEKPFSRNYVDVDAHTGEIIGTFSLINYGDVQGYGSTLYNGMQPIIVSDEDFPLWPPPPSHWHLDSWNAYGGSGESWWLADPNLGNQGGYADSWFEVLETDSILLTGTNPILSFYQRYSAELPVNVRPPFDGWDGMNVRISVDSGKTWQVLMNPTPAYTCSSLFSFGRWHSEGSDIPGWAGLLTDWSQVTFDLSAYSGQTIQLRFAFAADAGLSTVTDPELFGWQIDDMLVSSSDGVLFFNSGALSGLSSKNLFREVTLIEGKYRLRETTTGGGIATYNSMNNNVISASIDFVDSDSLFSDQEDRHGVSVHWALESVYDYYLTKHGRKSYDDADGRLLAYANWIFFYPDGSTSPNNASWSGSSSHYGGGDGTYWGPFGTLDFVGHEITHGVTQYSAGLIYGYEPGALNESFSDIFGTALEFYKKGVAGDWLIGKDNNKSGSFARSLANPNLREDPDTYQGQYWVAPPDTPKPENDYGGVHTNSGVQNHWFYLLCQGGSGVNDKGDSYSVTGIGLEDAEQIAYRNLTVYLTPTSKYYDATHFSRQAAIDLFGEESAQARSVVDAWDAVGIHLEPDLKITTDSLRFISDLHQPDTLKFTIANNGLDSLRIERFQLSTGYFHVLDTLRFPLVLGKDQNRELRFVFTPQDYAPKTDSLILASNDPRRPSQKVILQGNTFHQADANTIYAIADHSSKTFLATLNAADSGKPSLIGSTGIDFIRGLALHHASGYLFGAVPKIQSSMYIKLDAQTGLARKILEIPESDIRAITFQGDTLWCAGFGGKLFRIELQTGETKFIGHTGISNLSGLAINPATKKLWAASGANKRLYILDRKSAQRTWERACNYALHWISFDAGGQLFGLFSPGFYSNTNLALLDTAQITTGANDSIIGDTGYQRIFALAIRGDVAVGVHELATTATPSDYALCQNYPNPFNPTTTIEFALPKASFVVLKIYNLLGEEVATLIAEQRSAGIHRFNWDARGLASGVYLYRLEAGEFVLTKKLLLMR